MATVDEILTRQAYAAGDGAWTEDNNYPSYTLYVEPEYVPVTNKRIADFNDQVSVRGEQNAQFVGFQLPRYDDGLDLTAAHLYIHYQTVYGGSDSVPCNVSWSDNYIRLCWQVPAQATQEPDRVQMMIYATGTNSMGERVTWKTLPASYTIHDGLDIGGGIPEPDPSWYEQFVVQMEGKVSTAQGYANDAQASKTAAAGSAAESAQSAAASAKALEDNRAYVESQKETFVGYNRRETDTKYANALIGTASGTGRVTVGDAWEAPVTDLEVSGRSEQMVTTGAQLLDCSKLNKSAGGAVVNYGDGGYSISGTGALTVAFSASYQLDYLKSQLKPGNLTLRSDLTIPKMYVRIWDGNTVFAEMQGNSTKQITQDMIDNENVRVECFFHGNAGSTITPGTYHPMLYQSGDGTWEPYTGGKPSPSPEYPQEIVSTDVTAVTVTGANNQSKTASITLTEPLCGIGDVRDRIMCRDGVWGIERYVALRELTEGIVYSNQGGQVTPNNIIDNRYVAIWTDNYKGIISKTAYADNRLTAGYCNIAGAGKVGEWNKASGGKENIYTINSNGNIFVTVPIGVLGIGVDVGIDEVNAAVKQYVADHDVYAMFERATPTWEPLPSAAQSALNALTTYTGTTHVTVTAGGPEPDVGLGYVQDTRAVIADLQAQINEIRGGTT